MTDNCIVASVRYRGQYVGSVHITRTAANEGYAIIGGQTRTVVYKMTTRGTKKGSENQVVACRGMFWLLSNL